jgi:hypothetical protein
MSKEQQLIRKALARIERKPASGNLTDDPISIGLDKSIRIDMSKLPAPTNEYDADYAWVEHRPGSTSILFGKQNRDEANTLRTRLEIRYPVENLVRHFWGNSRKFHEKLKEFANEWPVDKTRDATAPQKMKAGKEHSEWANFESMAHAGTEASIDFYRMPASGIAQFAKGQGSDGLRCTSVVRVHLTVFELLRLFDEVATVVDQAEGYLPKSIKEMKEVEERS